MNYVFHGKIRNKKKILEQITVCVCLIFSKSNSFVQTAIHYSLTHPPILEKQGNIEQRIGCRQSSSKLVPCLKFHVYCAAFVKSFYLFLFTVKEINVLCIQICQIFDSKRSESCHGTQVYKQMIWSIVGQHHKRTYYRRRNILHHEKSAKFLMVVVNLCRGVPCISSVNDCLSAAISSKFEMAAGIEHFCEMLPIVLICPCGWPQRAFFLWHHEPLSEEQFWWWWQKQQWT